MSEELRIEGAYAAMITPFSKDGQVSESGLKEFMQFYIDNGLDGVFAVSNVGEFAALSLKERCDIITLCVEYGKGKIRVCPGVSDLNLDVSLELADHAGRCGADAVILSAPYYYPYPDDYIEHVLMKFLEESPLPVIFYHSPKFADPVPMNLLLRILDHPKVAGLKESSGDVKFLIGLMNQIKERHIDVDVMLGWEELMVTGMVNGTKGSITSCGGIVPELMTGIRDSFLSGDMEKACKYQNSVARIAGALASYGFPQGYKMGMAARGFGFQINQSVHMSAYEERLSGEVPKLKKLIEDEFIRVGL